MKIKFTELQWSQAGFLNYKDIYGHTIYKPSNQLEKTMDSLYFRLALRLGNEHELNPWLPILPKVWYRKQVMDFMNEPGNLFKNGKAKKGKVSSFLDSLEKTYLNSSNK